MDGSKLITLGVHRAPNRPWSTSSSRPRPGQAPAHCHSLFSCWRHPFPTVSVCWPKQRRHFVGKLQRGKTQRKPAHLLITHCHQCSFKCALPVFPTPHQDGAVNRSVSPRLSFGKPSSPCKGGQQHSELHPHSPSLAFAPWHSKHFPRFHHRSSLSLSVSINTSLASLEVRCRQHDTFP